MQKPTCKEEMRFYKSPLKDIRKTEYHFMCLYVCYIYVTVHPFIFLISNQPDALIIQIYSVIKLYMFHAHHQELSTVHLALVSFMQVFDDRFQAESGWNCKFIRYKTLHVSGIFSAHHQEFSTVHLALVSFVQVSDDRFQAESGWNCSSILTLLGSDHQKSA